MIVFKKTIIIIALKIVRTTRRSQIHASSFAIIGPSEHQKEQETFALSKRQRDFQHQLYVLMEKSMKTGSKDQFELDFICVCLKSV